MAKKSESKKKQNIKQNNKNVKAQKTSVNKPDEEALNRQTEKRNEGKNAPLVPEELFEKFKDRMVRVVYEHGQDICTVDDEPDGVYFLQEGTAEVLDRDGAQINVMHEGQYFGEYAVLAHQRRLSTVRSMGKTVCYRLSPEDMNEIFAQYPEMYGEILKRLYGQLSKKHERVLELSRSHRGVLQAKRNKTPMSVKRLVLQYGLLAAVFVLSAVFIPQGTDAPLFALPLAMMFIYAIVSRRTLESLIVSGVYAAFLLYKTEPAGAYCDAVMETMCDLGNVSTGFIMGLMGSVIALIEASGSVTAFKKWADKRVKGRKSALFASAGIMAATAIDDGLNMVCASQATLSVSDKKRVPHEASCFLLSFLPTVLSSFIPLSLWGIFVIGTINTSYREGTVGLFCQSIPFNFYSIVVLIACVAFCAGVLPKNRALKAADKRVAEGGKLWPAGSERYLVTEEPEMWGKIRNIILPILVLAVSSLAVRSLTSGGFVVDSAVGLFITIVFMFFLYGSQKLMSPDEFVGHAVRGMQDALLPVVIYLLTTCFSDLLDRLAMGEYFDKFMLMAGNGAWALPAVLFIASMLLTVVLGSSWSMYTIAFPIAIRMGMSLGVGLPLCVGAVAAAGIAGEKNCTLTGSEQDVASAVGCNPEVVKSVQLQYSLAFTGIAAVFYLVAGFVSL